MSKNITSGTQRPDRVPRKADYRRNRNETTLFPPQDSESQKSAKYQVDEKKNKT